MGKEGGQSQSTNTTIFNTRKSMTKWYAIPSLPSLAIWNVYSISYNKETLT